jgi:hypothetical protein
MTERKYQLAARFKRAAVVRESGASKTLTALDVFLTSTGYGFR